MIALLTRSSAVAERPRDASCLSVVSFNIPIQCSFLLLVTAASDLLVHKILLNSVLLSPIVSGGVRPKLPGQKPVGHNPFAQRRVPVHLSWQYTTSDCDLNNEIQQRIKLASAAFGRLSHRVFLNRNLAIATKIAVYKAICIFILLYSCESWTPYRRHIKTLEAFHIRCLKSILDIH